MPPPPSMMDLAKNQFQDVPIQTALTSMELLMLMMEAVSPSFQDALMRPLRTITQVPTLMMDLALTQLEMTTVVRMLGNKILSTTLEMLSPTTEEPTDTCGGEPKTPFHLPTSGDLGNY